MPATDHPARQGLHRGRWTGAHPTLEVWYQTLTDPGTGAGAWIHHELASVAQGLAELRGHVAVFPPDDAPELCHFEPVQVPVAFVGRSFDTGQVRCEDGRTTGEAGPMSWILRWEDDGPPLEVFPRRLWDRPPAPGVQIVPDPTATFDGYIAHPGGRLDVHGGRGAAGRIYGRSNADRWGWLHADLGDGDVLEVVTAAVDVPVLGRVGPRAFVRLRIGGVDLPRLAGTSAVTMRTDLHLPRWEVAGLLGTDRLRVEVIQPRERCVEVELRDPGGRAVTCTHTTRADVSVVLEERDGLGWSEVRTWALAGTGHAEVGRRAPV